MNRKVRQFPTYIHAGEVAGENYCVIHLLYTEMTDNYETNIIDYVCIHSTLTSVVCNCNLN